MALIGCTGGLDFNIWFVQQGWRSYRTLDILHPEVTSMKWVCHCHTIHMPIILISRWVRLWMNKLMSPGSLLDSWRYDPCLFKWQCSSVATSFLVILSYTLQVLHNGSLASQRQRTTRHEQTRAASSCKLTDHIETMARKSCESFLIGEVRCGVGDGIQSCPTLQPNCKLHEAKKTNFRATSV